MTIRQMSRLVHPYSAVRKVTVLLTAYFDESGLGDPAVFAFSGYIAPEAVWERFEKKWRSLLSNPLFYENDRLKPERASKVGRPLDFLHACEMEGLGSGRFRAIGQRNRDRLTSKSVSISIESGAYGISTAVVMDCYKRLSDRVRAVIEDPYLLCFQYLVTEVKKKADMFIGEDPSESIAYVFEDQPQWRNKANELWTKSIDLGYKTKYRMGSLTFGEKKAFLPLQASDRLAYETYLHFIAPNTVRHNWDRITHSNTHSGR